MTDTNATTAAHAFLDDLAKEKMNGWRREIGGLVIQTGFGYGWNVLFKRRFFFVWKDADPEGPNLWWLALGKLEVSWPWDYNEAQASKKLPS